MAYPEGGTALPISAVELLRRPCWCCFPQETEAAGAAATAPGAADLVAVTGEATQ